VADLSNWIISTTAEDFEVSKAKKIHAFSRESDRDKIKPGDKTVEYIIRSQPPVFVGSHEITSSWKEAKELIWTDEKTTNRIMWPWQFEITPLRLGAVDARKLSTQLSFIENKKRWSAWLIGSPANFRRSIPDADYQLICDELSKPPIPYQVRPARPQAMLVTRVPRVPKIRFPRALPPKHNELRDMIKEIGLMKKMVSETEYEIEHLYLDAAWRTEAQKMPSCVWEVHMAGNFYEALAKLQLAWEYWRAQPILVTESTEQAEKQMGGLFSQIKPHVRIIAWQRIVRWYALLKDLTDLEKELGL
jgi:predicted RNA-binding protein